MARRRKKSEKGDEIGLKDAGNLLGLSTYQVGKLADRGHIKVRKDHMGRRRFSRKQLEGIDAKALLEGMKTADMAYKKMAPATKHPLLPESSGRIRRDKIGWKTRGIRERYSDAYASRFLRRRRAELERERRSIEEMLAEIGREYARGLNEDPTHDALVRMQEEYRERQAPLIQELEKIGRKIGVIDGNPGDS